MQVDQARRHDQPTRVNVFNFGFRIPYFGFGRDDFAISDVKIGNLVPLIRGIDHTPVANDDRAHVAIPPHK
jgi:hypothetical protein